MKTEIIRGATGDGRRAIRPRATGGAVPRHGHLHVCRWTGPPAPLVRPGDPRAHGRRHARCCDLRRGSAGDPLPVRRHPAPRYRCRDGARSARRVRTGAAHHARCDAADAGPHRALSVPGLARPRPRGDVLGGGDRGDRQPRSWLRRRTGDPPARPCRGRRQAAIRIGSTTRRRPGSARPRGADPHRLEPPVPCSGAASDEQVPPEDDDHRHDDEDLERESARELEPEERQGEHGIFLQESEHRILLQSGDERQSCDGRGRAGAPTVASRYSTGPGSCWAGHRGLRSADRGRRPPAARCRPPAPGRAARLVRSPFHDQ